MPEGKAVSAMFSGIAGRYDFANHFLSGGIDYYWRWVMVRRVRRARPADVVDLATGSGDVLFALADKLPPGTGLLGLDFCEPMLDQARGKRVRRERYRSLRFEFGDCMQLGVPDASCDAVTIAFGLRNFEDRDRGLREMLRILRPGGRCYILEFTQPARWLRPFYYFYLKHLLPVVAGFATGKRDAYHYLAGTIEAFPTKEAISAELKAAGFAGVRATGLTASIVALHEATKAPSGPTEPGA